MRRSAGLTLLELLIVLALAAILVAVCIPSFTPVLERYRIASTAERIVADIALARTEALHRDKSVYFVSRADGGAWCQGIHQADGPLPTTATAACDCSAIQNGCNIRNVTALASQASLSLSALTVIGFEPIRGLPSFWANANNVTLPIIGKRYALTLKVDQNGIISVCTPANKPPLGNYPAC